MTGNDAMELLREANPARRGQLDQSEARLAHIRAEVDDRVQRGFLKEVVTTRARRSRRPALLAAAVVVAVIGAVALSLVQPGSGPSLAGTSAALDPSGEVDCHAMGGNTTTEIAPTQAQLRLLPTYLPSGWKIGRMWARREAYACTQTPSLTAVVLGQDGQVQSSVMIRGPLDFTVDTSNASVTDTTVAGAPAKLFINDSPKGPGERVWLWKVAGRTWYMKTYGFDDAANAAIADAVRLAGDQVTLDASTAPNDLTVIARRSGPAFGAQTVEQWYVTLGQSAMNSRADGEVWMRVAYIPGGPLGLDGAFPDQYVSKVNGAWVIKQFAYGGMESYEGQPGVAVMFDPPWSGGQPSLGSMPADEWAKVVQSLVPVPVSDPRLTTLWAQH